MRRKGYLEWSNALVYGMEEVEYKQVQAVYPKALSAVIRGNVEKLWISFKWSTSPQGYKHWETRAEGEVPLTDRDLLWLIGLRGYTEERDEA